jgi:hypothetical protein
MQNMPQQDDKEKSMLDYLGSEGAPSLYVNSVEMGASAWDVRVKLGEAFGQYADGRPIVKHLATLVMSPAHAKAMMEALQITVKTWEDKFGEIDLPRLKQGIGPEVTK